MKTRDRIKDELEAICRKDAERKLRPHAVVKFASNPKTALHSKFEWDNTKAAHEYRLWQARELIAVYVTITRPKSPPVRAWVSITSDRVTKGGGYRATVDVLKDRSLMIAMLADAKLDIERLANKYAALLQSCTHLAKSMNALRQAVDAEIQNRRNGHGDADAA